MKPRSVVLSIICSLHSSAISAASGAAGAAGAVVTLAFTPLISTQTGRRRFSSLSHPAIAASSTSTTEITSAADDAVASNDQKRDSDSDSDSDRDQELRTHAEIDDPGHNRRPRVVVTGLGVISGCGVGADDFFDAIVAGQSSLGRVQRFNASNYPCQIASEVPAHLFVAEDHFVQPKNAKSNDRYTHFAVAAARQALKNAGLGDTPETLLHPERVGVMVGSAFGGMETLEQETLKLAQKPHRPKVSPFTIPALLGNTASGVIGIECGCKGPNYGIVSACASGSHAIGEAMGMIRDGHADVMVAGGTEATITPLCFAGFCAMKAMNTQYNDNPTAASRPFDKDRGGFIMGEGAGVVVLESLDYAQKRGARIYCELVGYGATCDAHHITTPAPEGRGLAAAMEMAVQMAGIDKSRVSYINAHGTSTNYNDKFETMAIKTVFGEHATTGNLVVSSTKGVTGHTLGAAGGIEAVAVAKSIFHNIVPPTINYETADPECDLDYVPNVRREMIVDAAMSTNLGFGGHNAAILFQKYQK